MTDGDSVKRPWTRIFGGAARPFTIAAVVLSIVGVLCVLLELQSPSLLLWTGTPVTGREVGGVISYSFHGKAYTITGPSQGSDSTLRAVTVDVNPSDPGTALMDRAITRWLDAALSIGWFVIAVSCLAAGQLRRYRRQRRPPKPWDLDKFLPNER